ncbi:MAG TPA: hypothetical protein PLU81_06205 [Deltaproteobacteria bacterium]|mgnify:CR=1 FL=1|nr:hypothetical protein [Deltaproteobacteria bacterium]HPJ94487.1 hypothetical protein [Deltaproteobacteria bacterium]HPR51362.1 hypothetical protein [Deltaproteobacteria bacterium]
MKKGNKDQSSKPPVVGVGWYTEIQWDKLQAVAVDPKILEESYEEWVDVFIKGCALLENAGISTVKIAIDVDELVRWCRQEGLAVDADARSRFVTEKLREIEKA